MDFNPYYALIIFWVNSFSVAVALTISVWANIALITAIPHMPEPDNLCKLFLLMPPMATTGMLTASQIFFKLS